MEDNSGYINLKSLASSSGGPRWTLDGGDGYFYQYNPCVGFENEKFADLAVRLSSKGKVFMTKQ